MTIPQRNRWLPCILLGWLLCSPGSAAERVEVDAVVFGATPGGIAAAVELGREGRSVLLVEPTSRIGGLTANGLSHPDFRTFEAINGFYLDLTRRTEAYYREKYGSDSQQVRDSLRGTHAEPKVNLLLFEQMLAEHPSIRLERKWQLQHAAVTNATPSKIAWATFATPEGTTVEAHARMFIDGSYEGDLMAQAGVAYHVGREGRDQYGESLAPEAGDTQVQGYNFRLCMTNNPANRVMPSAPEGYRREDYVEVIPLLEDGRIKTIYCGSSGGIYKTSIPTLPNDKRDINDVSRAPVRLSLPGRNSEWPDGDAATRQRIFAEHVRHNVGLIYFLQNDEAVPERFRTEAREWGWCRDEFVENHHLPVQLYVREARRMIGRHVFTQSDVTCAPGDARAILHPDAIAIGDYGPNCHGTEHTGSRYGGLHSGEFYHRAPPYQIPYGALLPKECENLLVPVAVSSSHVGFCALRLEPIWSSLGQAAGIAAHLALEQKVAPAAVPPAEIQRRLHTRGAATIYTSDVPVDSPDFPAVQWWGTLGGFHGVEPQPKTPGERGKNVVGQFYEAFPGHAAGLDLPLTPDLRQRWLELARSQKIDAARFAETKTRGDFLRAAFASRANSKGD